MILFTKKENLEPGQKELLKDNNVLVIECENPGDVRIVNPDYIMNTNDLMMSALKAIVKVAPSGPSEIFLESLYKRLCDQEADQKAGK